MIYKTNVWFFLQHFTAFKDTHYRCIVTNNGVELVSWDSYFFQSVYLGHVHVRSDKGVKPLGKMSRLCRDIRVEFIFCFLLYFSQHFIKILDNSSLSSLDFTEHRNFQSMHRSPLKSVIVYRSVSILWITNYGVIYILALAFWNFLTLPREM